MNFELLQFTLTLYRTYHARYYLFILVILEILGGTNELIGWHRYCIIVSGVFTGDLVST